MISQIRSRNCSSFLGIHITVIYHNQPSHKLNKRHIIIHRAAIAEMRNQRVATAQTHTRIRLCVYICKHTHKTDVDKKRIIAAINMTSFFHRKSLQRPALTSLNIIRNVDTETKCLSYHLHII